MMGMYVSNACIFDDLFVLTTFPLVLHHPINIVKLNNLLTIHLRIATLIKQLFIKKSQAFFLQKCCLYRKQIRYGGET